MRRGQPDRIDIHREMADNQISAARLEAAAQPLAVRPADRDRTQTGGPG